MDDFLHKVMPKLKINIIFPVESKRRRERKKEGENQKYSREEIAHVETRSMKGSGNCQ